MDSSSGVPKFVVIINLAGGIIGIVFCLLCEFVLKKDIPNDADEFALMKRKAYQLSFEKNYKLKKITVNLFSRTTRLRFLSTNIQLALVKKDHLDFVKKNEPIIYDSIINIASQTTPEKLNTVTGKIIFESRIKNTIHKIINKIIIRKIYFTKFVIQ